MSARSGRAQARASVPASTFDVTRTQSVQKPKDDTLETKFRRITGIDDPNMISEFLSLTFLNDKPIFESSSKAQHRDMLYQVACVIATRGPEATLNFIKTGSGNLESQDPIKWADAKTLVLNLPTVDTKKREDDIRERTLKDAQIFREKTRALKGPPCHKCRSTNTTMSERQTTSGDEGKTVFVTCIDCGFGWRAS